MVPISQNGSKIFSTLLQVTVRTDQKSKKCIFSMKITGRGSDGPGRLLAPTTEEVVFFLFSTIGEFSIFFLSKFFYGWVTQNKLSVATPQLLNLLCRLSQWTSRCVASSASNYNYALFLFSIGSLNSKITDIRDTFWLILWDQIY